MLSFFPEMYPDEILYSVLGRYHRYSGNQKVKLSFSDLAGEGHNFSSNSVILPRNLVNLSIQTQRFGISFNDLLYDRTFFPYLVLFASDQQMKIAKTWAYSSSRTRSSLCHKTQDCLSTHIGPLKYCPICLEEEYSVYGEAYWHRHHQIPCVLVCTKHRIALQYSQIFPWQCSEDLHTLEKQLISSFHSVNYLNAEEMKVAIELADGIQWVFDNFDLTRKLWLKHARFYSNVYFLLLAQKGFVTKYGVILKSQFTRDIVRYYGRILSFWDLSFSVYRKDFWPLRVFMTYNRDPSQIYHFLMMQYLSGSIQQFFKQLQNDESIQVRKPTSRYYSYSSPCELIKKEKMLFRITWMKKCEKFVRASIGTVDRHTVSTRSWLYKDSYDWVLNNLATSEHTRIARMLNKNNQDHMKRTHTNRPPFVIAETRSGRFESQQRYPTARNERKVLIKSVEEARKAYIEWRLSHGATKKRVLSSSDKCEYNYDKLSKIPYKLEITPAKFGMPTPYIVWV